MQDIVAALITHLGTVAAITTLVSTRIYGGELPEADIGSMPRKAIILRYAGGIEEFRTHRSQRQRVDIFSYGEDYLEAGRVDRAVADALIAIRRTESESTLLHAVGYAGVFQLKEPDTGWRYNVRTATITAGETVTT